MILFFVFAPSTNQPNEQEDGSEVIQLKHSLRAHCKYDRIYRLLCSTVRRRSERARAPNLTLVCDMERGDRSG